MQLPMCYLAMTIFLVVDTFARPVQPTLGRDLSRGMQSTAGRSDNIVAASKCWELVSLSLLDGQAGPIDDPQFTDNK